MSAETKYALVTGASSGIGLCYARELASLGYNIIAVSNEYDKNTKIADSTVGDFGVNVIPVFKDLSRAESAQELYDFCKEKGLEVEVLINNVGVLSFGTLSKTDSQKIRTLVELHVYTPTMLCKLFSEQMKLRGKGYILIMSSATVKLAYPTISVYNASKRYLQNFADSIWYELHPYGIGVTTVFPGAVDTPLYQLDDSKRKLFRRIGLMMSPEKLAHKALIKLFHRTRHYTPGFITRFALFIASVLPPCVIFAIMRNKRLRGLF